MYWGVIYEDFVYMESYLRMLYVCVYGELFVRFVYVFVRLFGGVCVVLLE